jgi:hypothetical protein
VLQQTQNLDSFGERLNASVVVHSDSEDAQVSLAARLTHPLIHQGVYCHKCVLFLAFHLYQ